MTTEETKQLMIGKEEVWDMIFEARRLIKELYDWRPMIGEGMITIGGLNSLKEHVQSIVNTLERIEQNQ